jgi:hypothetical protein
MDRLIAFAGVFLLTFTLGCGGGKAGDTDGSTHGFANSAILTGDPVGLDLDLPSKITRTISATVSGSDMTGATAFLGRLTATESSGRIMVPVTNQGSRWHCFIEATTFELLDGSGNSLGTPIGTYLHGSVGWGSTSGVYTDTCLEPGGTGYFLDTISATAFTMLESVRIVLTSGTNDYLPAQTSVVPVSYTASERDQVYAITIANQGPMTATLYNGEVVYFDDSDTPVFWGFATAVQASDSGVVTVDIAPGATGKMLSDSELTHWTGTSTRQLVMIDFDVYSNKQSSHAQVSISGTSHQGSRHALCLP